MGGEFDMDGQSSRSVTKTTLSRQHVVFISVIVLGVFFRLINLDGKVFWIDEAFTALRISGLSEPGILQTWAETPLTTAGELLQYQFPAPETSLIDTVRGLAMFEPQLPPLYFVLTRLWVQLFGNAIATIRSFGAVASILTLPMMALLSRELFSSRLVAYVAAALMAVSPFQVVYAQEARPYSLWTLGVIAMNWAFLKAIRTGTWKSWLAYAVISMLSLYTFVYSLFVLLAHAVYVVWQQRPVLRKFLLSAGMALLAFAPWLWAIALNGNTGLNYATWQRQPANQSFLALPIAWSLSLTRTFLDFDQPYGFGVDRLWPYGLVVLAVLAGVGYCGYQLWQSTRSATWGFLALLLGIPALGVVTPDLLLGWQQSTVSRYFVPCWVALLLGVAWVLAGRWQERIWRWILVGIITLGVLSCSTSSLASTWWNKTGAYIPVVSQAVNATDDPLIVSASDWWIFSLAHYLRPDVSLQMVTQFNELPDIPRGYSDYFLYSIPASVRDAVTQYGFQVEPFKQLDQVPMQCLFPPDFPERTCPPQG
jgi:uncharacterized membrane protein